MRAFDADVAWRWLVVGGACALPLFFSACGGPDTGDLFGDGAGATGSGSGASSSGGASVGGDGGAGPGSGGAGTSTGGASAGGGTTTSTSTGGSTSTSTGGGSSTSTGTGGTPTATLDCGQTTCPVENESACCWDQYQLHGPPRAECVTGPPNNDGCATEIADSGLETRIECQLPSHCATGLCCAHREFFSSGNQQLVVYQDIMCEDQCSWPDVQLCSPAADTCPIINLEGQTVQTVCKQSQLLPAGYYVCGLP